MTGSQATSMLTMEIFVEQHELLPVRVRGKTSVTPMTWSAAVGVREKEASQAGSEFTRHFLEVHPAS